MIVLFMNLLTPSCHGSMTAENLMDKEKRTWRAIWWSLGQRKERWSQWPHLTVTVSIILLDGTPTCKAKGRRVCHHSRARSNYKLFALCGIIETHRSALILPVVPFFFPHFLALVDAEMCVCDKTLQIKIRSALVHRLNSEAPSSGSSLCCS